MYDKQHRKKKQMKEENSFSFPFLWATHNNENHIKGFKIILLSDQHWLYKLTKSLDFLKKR